MKPLIVHSTQVPNEYLWMFWGQQLTLSLTRGQKVPVPAMFHGEHELKASKAQDIRGVIAGAGDTQYFRPLEPASINGQEIHRIWLKKSDLSVVIEQLDVPTFEKRMLTRFKSESVHDAADEARWSKYCRTLGFLDNPALHAILKSSKQK